MKVKKLLAILVAAVMMFALLPATVFAANTTAGTAAQLATAITNAASGDTITLTTDITGFTGAVIEKTITIDMNGYNITGTPTLVSDRTSQKTAFLVRSGGDLTLDNTAGGLSQLLVGQGEADEYLYRGIVIDNNGAGTAKATVKANVSIETGLPVRILGSGSANETQLDVYGRLVVTDDLPNGDAYAGIQGNGSAGMGGTVITIHNGAEVLNEFSSAMYIPQGGVVNINGGTIIGKHSAIAIKAGTLNISGGTLRATGPATIPPEGWSNGINGSGCAIQIESNDSYSGNIIINITGGTISSTNGYAIYEYLDTVTAGDPDPTPTTISLVNRISVSGGTLTSATGLNDMMLSAELSAKGVVTTDSTEVTATADVTYTVIIPASVDFGTIYKNSGTKTKDFPITVQDALLEAGKAITVTQTSTDLTMTAGSSTLAFTFTPPTGLFVFTGNETKTGTVACDTTGLTAAGSYKGYMTFSVVYN